MAMYESDFRGYILLRRFGCVGGEFKSYEAATEFHSRLIAAAESTDKLGEGLESILSAVSLNVSVRELTVVLDEGDVFRLKHPDSFVGWFPSFKAAREKLESIAEVYRQGYYLKVVYEPPPQQVVDFDTDVERCFHPEDLKKDQSTFAEYGPVENRGHSWADSVGEEYHAVWGYDPKFGFTLLSGGIAAIELSVGLGLGVAPVLAKREYHYSDNGEPVYDQGEKISESEAFRTGNDFSHILVRKWFVHPWDQRYPGAREEDTIEWSYWEL